MEVQFLSQEDPLEKGMATHFVFLACRIQKKWYKRTYLQNRKTVTDVENKLMVTKVEEEEG